MKTALLVCEVILAIVVVVSILMQPSKSDALSGLVQGSNNETFYSKNKSKTREVRLERTTVISMILFSVIALVLNVL
ncbi:preprotein translocase subunit SecG [uncultured Clostridium sp.]|uniref:preprotein translocase subunit SecG n=1 Tax=uncultured Clostridium sp. TaxID=59620 RepID=UPI0025E9F104|nr:preprotein translocase subunit SecG [uncultured Clostridium sp.]